MCPWGWTGLRLVWWAWGGLWCALDPTKKPHQARFARNGPPTLKSVSVQERVREDICMEGKRGYECLTFPHKVEGIYRCLPRVAYGQVGLFFTQKATSINWPPQTFFPSFPKFKI